MKEISSFLRLTPCGIFQSPSSTGTFPLRFDFPIQKARCLNQEGTKVKTSAKAIFQDACGKRKREDPPGRKGGRAEGFLRGKRRKKSRRQSNNNTELLQSLKFKKYHSSPIISRKPKMIPQLLENSSNLW
ncbi:hypothetical protein [Alkalicoccus halolimnae]|uniref:Uncharacterized protein n=1 Tax=Alkalicoccus halolimnae TaxID=1667239 RepID=A0A5C7FIS5_9BACI|nr:hypothetical protein [Alkalicoccus halolimnae]TXF86204.1 hypothetical protein FTX54_06235 [Alkalicoccus halolimnae]